MKDILANATFVVDIVNHLLPVIISAVVIFGTWVVRTYFPQLKYIALLTEATNDAGIIKLAKYMATKNGGKHIKTDHLWESFVPAARAVSERYRMKID
jgi:hypothetical protein